MHSGDAGGELRRSVDGRAIDAPWASGVPVALQAYRTGQPYFSLRTRALRTASALTDKHLRLLDLPRCAQFATC